MKEVKQVSGHPNATAGGFGAAVATVALWLAEKGIGDIPVAVEGAITVIIVSGLLMVPGSKDKQA